MNDCPLCDLEEVTKWFYQDEDFVICDCLTCKTPMVVWRCHTFPSGDEICTMKRKAAELFPHRRIDEDRRSVSGHYHFHLRW